MYGFVLFCLFFLPFVYKVNKYLNLKLRYIQAFHGSAKQNYNYTSNYS